MDFRYFLEGMTNYSEHEINLAKRFRDIWLGEGEYAKNKPFENLGGINRGNWLRLARFIMQTVAQMDESKSDVDGMGKALEEHARGNGLESLGDQLKVDGTCYREPDEPVCNHCEERGYHQGPFGFTCKLKCRICKVEIAPIQEMIYKSPQFGRCIARICPVCFETKKPQIEELIRKQIEHEYPKRPNTAS